MPGEVNDRVSGPHELHRSRLPMGFMGRVTKMKELNTTTTNDIQMQSVVDGAQSREADTMIV